MGTAGEEPVKKDSVEANMVQDGSNVKVHYTLTVEGDTVDSSEGREPLEVTMGQGQLIPGFEKAMMGMKPGDKKSFAVSPEEGYGKENADAIQEVPRSQLPPDVNPEVGMTLYAQGPNGQPLPLTISEVKEETVVVNMNHPLAGKTLNFEIEITEVN
jgi:FKBP-type peptidyl-prolyl cis-trans isomerase SlpA